MVSQWNEVPLYSMRSQGSNFFEFQVGRYPFFKGNWSRSVALVLTERERAS